MPIMRLIKDVLAPGSPMFAAQLTQVRRDQAKLLRALHLLESPATRDIRAATDSAAEF